MAKGGIDCPSCQKSIMVEKNLDGRPKPGERCSNCGHTFWVWFINKE